MNQVGVALLFAIPAGILWSRLLRVLSEQRFWQVLTFSVVLVLYAGMEALGANGLIAVLGFGLTLSNFPGVDPGLGLTLPVTQMAESQQALLTFHSELAFLVRTFFFVLIGAVAELGIFREHPLLMVGTLGSLFLARWLAIHSSRWAWRGIAAHSRELIFWVMPRGLITVVLAIEVAQRARQRACIRSRIGLCGHPDHKRAVGAGQPPGAAIGPGVRCGNAGCGGFAEAPPATPAPAQPRATRRWVLNAVMLFLLAVGGVVLWYGNHPEKVATEGRGAVD